RSAQAYRSIRGDLGTPLLLLEPVKQRRQRFMLRIAGLARRCSPGRRSRKRRDEADVSWPPLRDLATFRSTSVVSLVPARNTAAYSNRAGAARGAIPQWVQVVPGS